MYGQGFLVTCFGENGALKKVLDELYPDTPVLVESDGCHSLWVNEAFIKENLSEDVSFLPKVGVWKKSTGELLGFFCEDAAGKVLELMPETTIDDYKKAILKFQDLVLPLGIQQVHEPFVYNSLSEVKKIVKAFRELDAEGKLLLRVRVTVTCKPDSEIDEFLEYIATERNAHGHYFEVQGVKLFIDGVVEERTAFLREDYVDEPGYKGEAIWKQDELNDIVLKTRLKGVPVHVHTMGDGATEMIINALEYASKKSGVTNLRDTFTHLQVVGEDQIKRMAALGITACVNTFWHFHEHSYYFSKDLPFLGPERADSEYRVRSLKDAGIVLSQGSDWPVSSPPNPLEGVEIGVTRKMPGSLTTEPLAPDESVSVTDMLRAVTIGGAYELETEHETGSIKEGKAASFILLDRDPTISWANEIHSIKVIRSWIDGVSVI